MLLQNFEENVKYIILKMHKYQKENNIIQQCVTNTQYLYSCINQNKMINKAIAKPYLTITNIDTYFIGFGSHVVIEWNNKIYDSSYEIYNKNTTYYNNIKEVLLKYPRLKHRPDMIKELIIDNNNMINHCNNINNDIIVITNKKHYDLQADYIETVTRNVLDKKKLKRKSILK